MTARISLPMVGALLLTLAACGGPPATTNGDASPDVGTADVPGATDAGSGMDVRDAGRVPDVARADVPTANDVPSGSDVSDVPVPPADVPTTGDAGAGEWLRVVGHQILTPEGTPFHGRGANLHDTRSCLACAWNDPDPQGVMRWSDELIDHWHANFIRFLLTSQAAPLSGQVQWQSIVDDPQYFQDIQDIVAHVTAKPGVYVIVTLFADPSIKDNNSDFDSEWPTTDSLIRYRMLAEAFHDNPRVLFGLTNEPHGDASFNAQLADIYTQAIDAIREVEDMHGSPNHIVVVQAPQGWARDLSYFVTNPIQRENVAYEIHPYNHSADFFTLITRPARTLPVIIGEYGPADLGDGTSMSNQDIMALWTLAQSQDIPHIAWNFHQRCPPDMLQDTASDGCGLSASTGYDFPRTPWGDMMYNYLTTPW